ncbi:oxidoreductase [Fulvivirga maritima]|uniref:oxidoreductase n=1 Tax=Fulvivirga maritima TaxID=2904247 RepID=UPI001F4413A4|nr:oxidoreductase [Fulvivirga maritima]UII27144.1 oxidoreductase [Fulvivirga maritima]
MKTLKAGLIGFGLGGRVFHAPVLDFLEGFELVKIRETKEDKIKVIEERYPEVDIVSDSDAIINDPEIDLVAVIIPNKAHYSVGKAVLEAEKHLVIDKPFTVTTEEADELIALAKEKNKKIFVFQNRRWDSDFLTVKKLISEGKLGRIVELENHFDRFRNTLKENSWKEEGDLGTGLVYDLGSHLIDQAQVLFGLPNAVTAFMAKQRTNSNITDNFELLLHYDDVKVTIKCGMLVKEPLPKYILLGEQGSFVKYGLDIQEATLDKAEKPLSDADWGEEPEEQWGVIHYEENGESIRKKVKSEAGNYPAFYENVYQVITEGAEQKVKPEEARNTIRIIELAIQSDEEKRTIPFS